MLAADGPNSIAVSNGIVGDEWTLWIVEMGLHGITQYNEWLRAGPISSSVLTARLARLVEADIMERVPYNSRPPRHDYRLTSRGRSMWPILLTMWDWEQTWVNDPSEHLPHMRHTTCGSIFSPRHAVRRLRRAGRAPRCRVALRPERRRGSAAFPSAATRRRSHAGNRPVELVDQTMALIGNRWSTALLGAAFMGATRFGEFEQRMGAPPTIVAERLRTFCDIGVLAAEPEPAPPRLGRLPPDRQGPRVLPGAGLGTRVGSALVPRARGAGDAHGAHALPAHVPSAPDVQRLP